MDFVFDFGNARVKWFNPRSNKYDDFRHAIVELSDGQWQSIVGRRNIPSGYAKINGVPYVFGDAARRHIIPERPRGASRYRKDYYGVAMAYALSEAFTKSTKSIDLFASHSPADFRYGDHQIAAAKGDWTVETNVGTKQFRVRDVLRFDEPLGGLMHYTLTESGVEKKNNPLEEITTLVVDAGGYTVDVAAIDPGGEIDPMSLRSTRTGVINMTERFEQMLRDNNPTMFQDAGDLDIKRIEKAILDKEYRVGKIGIDCTHEAEDVLNDLTNEVVQAINAAGGVANFDVILLTGGGAVLLEEKLTLALPRADFHMAEKKRALMKYANVFGGAKFGALLRNLEDY